ncbi:MAG: hypothetical protein ACLQDY_13925 [Streptosporangiaceae bacterium]
MNREGRGRPGQPSSASADTLEPGEAAGIATGPASKPGDDAPARPAGGAAEAAAPELPDASGRAAATGPASSDSPAPGAGPDAAASAVADPAGGAAQSAPPGGEVPPGGRYRRAWRRVRGVFRRPLAGHALLLAIYVAAGIAVTWPRVTYLFDGELPSKTDVTSYVWGLYWVAHQISHFGDPFSTTYMAAPAGIQLGFDTLMPLPGLLITPVTLLFGPAASFSILTILAPGLLCYVMYRAARLWLGQPGSIAAGALFGLSTMLTWQNWYHLNISLGSLFLPMTLEAAIRLRRRPRLRTGVALGLVLGGSVLVNQESAVLALLFAAALLVPWLIAMLIRNRAVARATVLPLCLGALVALVVAAPQLIAMAQYLLAGGASTHAAVLSTTTPAHGRTVSELLAQTYGLYGVGLPTLFSLSPRLATFGLGQLQLAHPVATYSLGSAQLYYFNRDEGIPTFGAVLTVLALAGLALAWRRRSAWWFGLLWLAGAALALGPALRIGSHVYLPLKAAWDGTSVSDLMPYTWLIRTPGLSALREADRLAVLGLVGAALLAGCAVDWLCRRRATWPALGLAAVLAAAEMGWSPPAGAGQTMPTAMPSVDQPIAADHSSSIVLDIPYGLRGGIPLYGARIAIRPLLLATADGHPRAISYSSWVPGATWTGISRHPFYTGLIQVQTRGILPPAAQLAAARRDLAALHIGWALIWHAQRPAVLDYLEAAGFRYDYQVSGVTVLRPAQDLGQTAPPGR